MFIESITLSSGNRSKDGEMPVNAVTGLLFSIREILVFNQSAAHSNMSDVEV